MLNAEGSAGVLSASRPQYMRAGSFFGAIQGKREQCGAIFTDLRHAAPRKLPMHSHELAFFALLLDGLYAERYGRRQSQYGPFTLMFRPAGIPHQDEIGPRGVRLYEIEIRPRWQKCLADCSAALDTPRDDIGGGPLLWLCMKLFREVQASTAVDDLAVESLVAEILSFAARACQQENRHVPGWLSRIQDKLRTEQCRRLTLDELARSRRPSRAPLAHLSALGWRRHWRPYPSPPRPHRLRTPARSVRLACGNQLCNRVRRPKPLHALVPQNYRHDARHISLRRSSLDVSPSFSLVRVTQPHSCASQGRRCPQLSPLSS